MYREHLTQAERAGAYDLEVPLEERHRLAMRFLAEVRADAADLRIENERLRAVLGELARFDPEAFRRLGLEADLPQGLR